MITITEIAEFETRLTNLMANFKAEVMAELKKVGIKQPDTFLQELSQPVPLVADEPPLPSEIPSMDGVTLEDEKPELPFLERGSADWKGLVKHLMTNAVSEVPQQGKKFQLNEKDWDYVKGLVFYKSELFSGNMTAEHIVSNNIDEADKPYFLEMQKAKESLT